MSFKHLFKAQLQWFSNKKETTRYVKNHTVFIEGKEILNVSAAKAFKGDPSLYNPEDLLLSSVVSCHMMSYLYVCAQHQIEVISYSDAAEATLEVLENGSGRFVEVRLFPQVVIRNEEQIALANELHTRANELCFIANSCNFKIVHKGHCEVE
ncbi:OsmC family protein [Flavobacterium sp. 7A]|uniref:OsmC family protein n=1 Tax=Flavobacterium sp. 7A TaxID=2940571 RepID=UPI0022267453|nr:OsmC family protein [Flavobacterium sp. 7A]MCW2120072.1 organic hydroperoxide reductase OsmC/OhrA [Flavobacterium sp. 7A]